MPLSSVYYDFGPILSYNAEMNIICGMRGNGKTYGAKKYVLDRFFKRGDQFVYCRRTDEELKKTKKKFLTDIASVYEDKGDLRVVGDELWFIPTVDDNDDDSDEDESSDKTTDSYVIVGYFMALNCYEKYKSGSYQKVKTLIYDEFMSKNGYLKDELFNFCDIHETVFRDRTDVKVIMISNTMSTVSPYFEAFNIKIEKGFKGIKKSTFSFKGKGKYTVVADFPESTEYAEHKRQTPSGLLAMITGYSNYSIDGEFMLDDSRNVVDNINKSSLEFRYNLILNNLKIGVYLYNGVYYFGDAFENGKTYATTAEEVAKFGALFVSKQWTNFRNYERSFKSDRMLFKDIKIKNEVILLMRKLIKGF